MRTQNVSEQNQKHFLCPGHKICVRNKCCTRGQTGKHLGRQQYVLVSYRFVENTPFKINYFGIHGQREGYRNEILCSSWKNINRHFVKNISFTTNKRVNKQLKVSCSLNEQAGLWAKTLQGALSRYFSVILQCRYMFLHQWKPKNNNAVLLPRTLSLHRNHLLLPRIT